MPLVVEGVEPAARSAFAEACAVVGPDAPTLCEGWTARDVAVHINLIERRWDSWLAVPLWGRVPPVGRAYDRLAERELARDWDETLARIRSGPRHGPLGTQWLRDRMMPREYLIHAEDVRRANGISVAVAPGAQDVAWSRLPGLAKRMLLVPDPFGVELVSSDGRVIRLKEGAPVAQLCGDPLELLLHVFGRTSVTKVEWAGDADAVAAAHVRDTSRFAQSLPRAFPDE